MKLVPICGLASVGFHLGSSLSIRENPITRVVELLGGLAERVEEDMDKQEDNYESYVCWGQAVIKAKTEFNTKARARIDKLESYISDLEAGRVELTSERTDLVKEIAGLKSDLETAEAQREQEKKDYEAAKDEMEKALDGLKEAIDVLKEATGSSLLGLRGTLNARATEGFSVRSERASKLAYAVELGRRFLSDGDALFLQRLMTGDVGSPVQKKLNRKASFKMKYKMRSGKIIETLEKMEKEFESNLEEAEERETKAEEDHDTLKESKNSQLEKAENALDTMAGEGGANGLSKEEAEEEVSDLKQQVEDDEGFIEQTKTDLKDMKKEWKTRKELMVGEIAAINKAKAILNDDEARENFRTSFKKDELLQKNKKVSFLQVGSARGTRDVSQQKLSSALEAIRSAAHNTKDSRLAVLASFVQLSKPGQFDKVIKKIDEMIKVIEDEKAEDDKLKEECESDRETNTAEAKETSNAIDDLTDDITNLEKEVKEHNDEIKEKEEEIATNKKELKEATRIREEEHEAWEKSDAADKMASELVEQSKNVLADFYKDNGLNLVQRRAKVSKAPEVNAGEAPPPPPDTWEGDYGGATEEANGIVGILEKIKEEIDTEREDAKTAEDDAQSEFDTMKSDTESAISDLESAIEDLSGSVADKEDTIASNEEEKGTKQDELETTIGILKEDQPGCDYITINYEMREKNREIETEGLTKAKEILEAEN